MDGAWGAPTAEPRRLGDVSFKKGIEDLEGLCTYTAARARVRRTAARGRGAIDLAIAAKSQLQLRTGVVDVDVKKLRMVHRGVHARASYRAIPAA